MSKYHTWYIRRNNIVKGPFPEKQIAQSLVLGRFKMDDEVSYDKEEWKIIADVPQLIPDILKEDLTDEDAVYRLEAARRWADERRTKIDVTSDSRDGESNDTMEYRTNRENIYQNIKGKRERAILQFFIVMCLAVGLVYFAFNYGTDNNVGEADCNAPAKANVNWQYCRMAGRRLIESDLKGANLNSTILYSANLFGADLANVNAVYADLSLTNLSFANLDGAILKGANLQRADLSQSNLGNADLSYADLRGAKLQQVKFSNTKLDNTIWIDGRVCLSGSVDVCKVAKQ